MTRPIELNYAAAAPPAGVTIEQVPGGVRVTIGASPLRYEVAMLFMKALGVIGLAFPVMLAFMIATLALREGVGIFGIGILCLFAGLWLLSVFAFVRDCREFQRVTILEADAEGLTWRRERGNRRRLVHIRRVLIGDVALLMEPRLISSNPGIVLSVGVLNDVGIPKEARKIWLYNGEVHEGFEIIARIRDALQISAVPYAAR